VAVGREERVRGETSRPIKQNAPILLFPCESPQSVKITHIFVTGRPCAGVVNCDQDNP